MKKTLTIERVGILALAIVLMLFAIVALCQRCGTHHPDPLPSPSAPLIDSINSAKVDTAATNAARMKKKNNLPKTKNNKKPTQSSLTPLTRSHRDERVN